MPGTLPTLVAHQGGWDEILFVLLPIGLFAGLLALANRRATQSLDQDGTAGTASTGGGMGAAGGEGDRDDEQPADPRPDAGAAGGPGHDRSSGHPAA